MSHDEAYPGSLADYAKHRLRVLHEMNASSSFNVRRGRPTDLPAVLALLNGAGLPTADLGVADDLQLWVSEVGNALAGCIGLQRCASDALLRSLAVAPEFRNRGLGHALVARLEEDARDTGIVNLVLLTETASPFFRNLGYRVVDRHSVNEALRGSAEFRSLCPASAVCMAKALARRQR